MSYKITLKHPSQIKFVCGLAVPNGFCHVMDMDFDNKQQFDNLKKAPGVAEVTIEKTTLKPGAYTIDGREVDYRSLHDWCLERGEVKYLDEEKPKEEIESETTAEQSLQVEASELDLLKQTLEQDQIAYKILSEEVGFLDEAIKYCPETNLVIQAGGNAGLYPLYLSERFTTVITIEPDKQNYDCLTLNIEGRNIFPLFGALGDQSRKVGISRHPENSGASQVCSGGEVSMFTIDEMGMDPDFIQLDIEGFEYPALQGALETIERCHPIIMIEEANHGERYGHRHGAASDFLKSLGYALVGSNRTDLIWR